MIIAYPDGRLITVLATSSDILVFDTTDPPILTDDAPSPNCTAHHGRLIPDPEGQRDLLAMAFYGAGVVLIDFTDATNPMILDQWNPGTDTWEVWHYNGWLITGDLNRGMDVLSLR